MLHLRPPSLHLYQLWAELGEGLLETEAWIHLSDRPWTFLLIAPSSDAASGSNWQNVGVDGIKMSAHLHDCSLSVTGGGHGQERQRERVGGRDRLKRCQVREFYFLLVLLLLGRNTGMESLCPQLAQQLMLILLICWIIVCIMVEKKSTILVSVSF